MTDLSVPLEELQDIGERYSSHVLRSFFRSNGMGSGDRSTLASQMSFAQPFSVFISSETLQRIQRILLLTVPAFLVCIIAGTIAFAAQPNTWDDIDDPTVQETVVEAALPSTLSTVLSLYAITSSIVFELVCSYLVCGWRLIRSIRGLIALISGFASRLLLVANYLSLVVIAKAAPKLALIGLAPYGFGLGVLSISLPVRVLIGLGVADNYEFTDSLAWLLHRKTARSSPVALAAVSREGDLHLPPELEHAASCPENQSLLRRVVHACIVFEWNFQTLIFVKKFLPFSIQTDLVLANSLKGYLTILTYHLLLVPMHVYFLYDVGNNLLVRAALVLSLVAAATTFVSNVVPTYRRTIHDYQT